jgi:hypothetical protein
MNDAAALSSVMTRLVESSPPIVLLLLLIGYFIWSAWRKDTAAADEKMQRRDEEFLNALREERDARLTQHREMMTVVAVSTQAIQAVRDALTELRHAITDKPGVR